ncbi:hypothetical protein LTR85_000233 [Meristemomyces frigidus]|nr:hypothetical protein LTR85_000233 [Meristemomyces frigidus]
MKGVPPQGKQVSIGPLKLLLESKRYIGVVEGDSTPQKFIPELVEMQRSGRLPLEKLFTTYPYEQLNQAMDDMHAGQATNIWTALLALGAFAAAAPSTNSTTILPSHTIYTFPNTTFVDIENVAVRPNGHILLNLLTAASVYTLDPCSAHPNASLVYTFPNGTKLDGLVEFRPDVFAFVVGDALNSTTATYAIWSLDFNESPPVPAKIADVPGSIALNGITTLTGSFSDTLLIADAKLGAVWRLDATTGISSIALKDSHFLPAAAIAFGINGVHVFEGTLYFSTSANYTFGSVPISANGTLLGDDLKIIATQLSGSDFVDYDDFIIHASGRYAWMANHAEDLVRIDLVTGEQVVVATGLTQPTAAAFARGKGGHETSVLYVVTQGNDTSPIISGEVVEVLT